MRILFAEDDKRLSKMIDFLLKKENYIMDKMLLIMLIYQIMISSF